MLPVIVLRTRPLAFQCRLELWQLNPEPRKKNFLQALTERIDAAHPAAAADSELAAAAAASALTSDFRTGPSWSRFLECAAVADGDCLGPSVYEVARPHPSRRDLFDSKMKIWSPFFIFKAQFFVRRAIVKAPKFFRKREREGRGPAEFGRTL